MKKKTSNNHLFIAAIIGLFMLYACNFGSLYDKVVDIPEGKWNVSNPVSFAFPVTDTLSYYSIVFSLRNNNDYPYSNLFLFIDTYSPGGKTRRDTVEVTLADTKGKWMGKGIGGIWQNKYYFRKNIRFPQSGEYKVTVSQAMRNKILEGIIDIGINIEPFKQD
jgi:gliding motility-associated lipoprotein GldH